MNKVMFTGRLVRDAEFTQGEKSDRLNFTIAVNRGFGKDSEADFIPVVTFAKPGSNLGKQVEYLTKGKMVAVEGRLQINQRTDEGGQRRTYVGVITDSPVEFLSWNKKSADAKPAPAQTTQAQPAAASSSDGAQFVNF